MKISYLKYIFAVIIICLLSCSNDSEKISNSDIEEETNEVKPEIKISNPSIEISNQLSIDNNNYILINDASANRAYIINKNAEIIHEWSLADKRLGNDAYLLPDGRLLAMLEDDDAQLKLGGFGGTIQLLGKNGEIQWNFKFSSKDFIAHHDAEMLPNGNVLFQAWERKSKEEASLSGFQSDHEVISDALYEVDIKTNLIVWEWHAWDHLVQMHDSSKSNFGNIKNNPQLINLNYNSNSDGDIMHANGLAYDSENDVIFLSVNFYSEIWAIDHSTNTEEAKLHLGGNYNKGGDLIYRFGNPDAYDNEIGKRLFDHQHHPNLLKDSNLRNILVFSNGFTSNQSTVYELRLPDKFEIFPNIDNEPKIVWSFTHPELHSLKVSGAERLPNGNTLITEGDFGFWEVTDDKEVVWKYKEKGFFWRGYHFNKDSKAIQNLGI